jgi:ubiquinone/menaquinone biosynthesis C-methylase UbiE
MTESTILEREERLRAWFTRGCDPLQKVIDGLDIGWGGMQRWATTRMPAVGVRHLDVACGYATFLAQLGWRFPAACLVGLNIDFEGPHALARPLLAEAGVAAALVQADARHLPFYGGSFDSVSCFLGMQDIEIGYGQEGVQGALAETARVLRIGGVLVLLDQFPFERFGLLLKGLPLAMIDRDECTLDVRWSQEVAERAVVLYAEGWATQAQLNDESARMKTRCRIHGEMLENMERQLAERGYYVPFDPVRMVVARKKA